MAARLEILEELEDGEEEDLARRHGGLHRTDSGLSTVSCGSWASEASDLPQVQVILASHWSVGWITDLILVRGAEYWPLIGQGSEILASHWSERWNTGLSLVRGWNTGLSLVSLMEHWPLVGQGGGISPLLVKDLS